MPILHRQSAGQRTAPDGSAIALPPAEALRQRGPLVQVTVSIASSLAQQLQQQGIPVPPPIAGEALIDTGASSTCVDEDAAQHLGLPAVDVVRVASASHAATDQNVYPIQIEIIGLGMTIDVPRAVGAPLAPQGLLLLIGRDVLQHGTFFYNGFSGQITFAI